MPNWDHLPNILQIKEILAAVKARPDSWTAARATAPTAAIEAIAAARAIGPTRELNKVHDMAGAMASAGVSEHAPDSGWLNVYMTIRAALHALIAWDSSADLLALTPDALRTIIDTCDGDVKHQAVLLLPAVIALSTP
jgi:hypothetical protein